MDRTGADSRSWFKSMEFYCYMYIRKAYKDEDWRTLIKVALGATPEISALLEFTFWQDILPYYV